MPEQNAPPYSLPAPHSFFPSSCARSAAQKRRWQAEMTTHADRLAEIEDADYERMLHVRDARLNGRKPAIPTGPS